MVLYDIIEKTFTSNFLRTTIFFLTIIGLLAIVHYAVDNLKSFILIIKSVLDPYFQPHLKKTLAEKFGSWAIVTGATDGIGKEYSRELAKRGINVILISRSSEKLVKTASEIEQEFKVKTKWIQADFSEGKKTFKHIKEKLRGIPIGILVNNVGRMYDYPEELEKVSEKVLWDIININIGATTMMTRTIIGTLKSNRKGAIVNISSGSEVTPLPYMNVYSASKMYIKGFTLALQQELLDYNIVVQLVTPMYIVTKMNAYSSYVMKGGLLFPDARTYVRSLIFTLDKTPETTGYWSHGIQYALIKLVPLWLRIRLAKALTKKLREMYFAEAREQKEVDNDI
ncbi:inactive hydroxysteroid dehydrogenase-like protein 1 isoform X2 [Condylostylus longicornis]|uniref:inactive hydroxysteroid dehydrogenase-like protein 1 isoform X2 n=1 Tax=Condylostylus longicornis TaxID=2530218 RepID=UPI00244E5380|nr:inactive hydroxysteroid dehydrogenase-like protein 1 isoform X2 [Condylostylus longicornis]